jgi:hypothetical protein
VEALVDTGSDLTWLPARVLRGIGVKPRHKKLVQVGPDQTVERHIGYLFLHVNGHETADEVVFAEPGDMVRLGYHTLEGFGLVDDRSQRFISLTTLMRFCARKLARAA